MKNLRIALRQHPTRQQFWRVVRFSATVLGTLLGIILLTRLCFAWNDIVPQTDHVMLRIVSSPETRANLRGVARGIPILPDIPYSVSDFLTLTRRVLVIDIAPNGSIAVILDRPMAEEEIARFSAYGAIVTEYNNTTVITNSSKSPAPVHNLFFGLHSTLWQGSDAQIFMNAKSSAVNLTARTITLRNIAGLMPPSIERTPNADTLFFASLSADAFIGLRDRIFTENTPGLSSFFELTVQNGISAVIDRTKDTYSYTFATPLTNETRSLVHESMLRSFARELTELPTLEGITRYRDDGSRAITLRTREEAAVVVRDESPYRFLNATTSRASITITETPAFLTVSNGQPSSRDSALPTCLAGTRAFVLPSALRALLPEETSYRAPHLASILWNTTTIASSSSATRMCIGE